MKFRMLTLQCPSVAWDILRKKTDIKKSMHIVCFMYDQNVVFKFLFYHT